MSTIVIYSPVNKSLFYEDLGDIDRGDDSMMIMPKYLEQTIDKFKIMKAIRVGDLETVKWLARKGEGKYEWGKYVCAFAVVKGFPEIAKWGIDHGFPRGTKHSFNWWAIQGGKLEIYEQWVSQKNGGLPL